MTTLKCYVEQLAMAKEKVLYPSDLSIWLKFDGYSKFCGDNIFPSINAINTEFYNNVKAMFYALNCDEHLCYTDVDKWLALFRSKCLSIIPAYSKQFDIINDIKKEMLKQETIAEGSGTGHSVSKTLASNTPQRVLNAKKLEDVDYMSNGGISEGDSSTTQSSKTYTNNILPQIKTMQDATNRQAELVGECVHLFDKLFIMGF